MARPFYEDLQERVKRLEEEATNLRLAEKALRESQARFESLFTNMNEGMALHEILLDNGGNAIDYVIVDANRAFERSTGIPRGKALGRKASELYGTGTAPYLDIYAKVALTGEPVTFETYFSPMGKTFLISAFSPSKGQFATVFEDITGAKQAEEALRESERRLIEAQHLAGIGDFTWDVESGEVTWSDSLFDLLRYDKSERIDYARVNAEIHHPDDLERVTRWLNECIESGKEQLTPNEYRLVRRDGEIIYVRTVGVIDRKEAIVVFATIQDITARKRTEDVLARSQAEFEAIFRSVPDAVIFTDTERRIRMVNPAFTQAFGYEPEEAVGRTTEFLYASEADFEDLGRRRYHSKVKNESGTFEMRYRRKDGTLFYSESLGKQVRNPDGRVVGLLGVHRDIAERKRAEEVLKESEKRAKWAAEVNMILAEIGQIVSSTLSIDEVYEQFAHTVRKIIPFDRLMIGLINEEQATWTLAYLSGLPIEDRRLGDILPLKGLSARVFQEKSVVSLDLIDEKKLTGTYPTLVPTFRSGMRSIMAAPLISRNWVIGTIQFTSRISGAYKEEELKLSGEVAAQIAGAMNNVLAYHQVRIAEEALKESEKRANRVAEVNRTIAELGRIISSSIRIEGVYEQFASVVRKIISFDRIMIGLINEDRETWTVTHCSEMDIEGRRGGDVLPLAGLTLDVFRKRSGTVFHYDERALPENYPMLLVPLRVGIKTTMAAPLILEDEVIGAIHFSSLSPEAYTDEDVTLAEDVARQIAGAVANTFAYARTKRAEEALRVSEARFREMADLLPQTVYEVNAEGAITYTNRHAFQLFGYSEEDFEKGVNVFQMLVPKDRDRAGNAIRFAMAGGAPTPDTDHQYRALRKDGSTFPVMIYSARIVREGRTVGLRGVIVDMSEQERAEKEKEKLQGQLHQAQKMESVGRLAGGVAHDFNNMLGIILGNAEMAALQVDPESPIQLSLQEILRATQRSAEIVRQLLAFARKQTISPKVVNLNDTISSMLKMLRRLIGEDIELAWMPGHELGPVKMDPSQVDQILANLVVNARDAIPGVGKITIETAKAAFDDSYCREHTGSIPGEYVLLAVSDTGSGMAREIMEHLFDPFFTTKEIGRGTGLGLATVYGIVKQNNGFINVYSEPGVGTTFKLYFPRLEGESVTVLDKSEKTIPKGTETVLIAEDEAPLLNIARAVLTNQGYTVLAARRPTEVLALAEQNKGAIHLLMTDVVMPEMNGRQLAELIKAAHPGLKCLYMSGYPADVVAHHGVLEEGVNFIEKPFSPSVLAKKVREVLDGPKS